MNASLEYRQALSRHLGISADRIHLYWKGRVALFAALQALGIGPGDEVILPALTCVVVPNAILYLGATPVYADVDPATLAMDPASVEALITPRTRVLIIQNTFGLSAGVDTLVSLAKRRGIVTIDDCTHGFGGTYKGVPNGRMTDFAFFSSQWNKPFSTGLGGFLIANRSDFDSSLQKVNSTLIPPRVREVALLRSLIEVRRRLVTDRIRWSATLLFRRLTRAGLVVGSSDPAEIDGLKMPPDYFKGFPSPLARVGMGALADLPAILARRRANGEALAQAMSRHGKWHFPSTHADDNSFLKFPLLVADRPVFFDRARSAGIGVSDWFVSPIHPVTSEFERWGLDLESVPVARDRSSKLVCLDTDTEDGGRLLGFAEQNLDLIE